MYKISVVAQDNRLEANILLSIGNSHFCVTIGIEQVWPSPKKNRPPFLAKKRQNPLSSNFQVTWSVFFSYTRKNKTARLTKYSRMLYLAQCLEMFFAFVPRFCRFCIFNSVEREKTAPKMYCGPLRKILGTSGPLFLFLVGSGMPSDTWNKARKKKTAWLTRIRVRCQIYLTC